MRMRGHVLIWHAEMPAWLKELDPTRDEAMAILRDHIFTVVGHFREEFPGLVTQWDVVNEGIDNDATRRQNVWQKWIGDDYMDLAFRWAREATGPDVLLFYNDYFDAGMTAGAEAVGGDFDDGDAVPSALPGATGALGCDAVAKCAAVRDLVTGMKERGVPIDGVGFQAHEVSPNPSDYRALTAWVGDLGLRWAITELDVPLPRGTEAAGRAVHQAPAYRRTLAACLDDPACDTFVTWGLTDRYTWWRTLIPGGVFSDTLHFDDEYVAKPAAQAMHDEFAARPATPRAPARVVPRLAVSGAARVNVRLGGRGVFDVKSVRYRTGACARTVLVTRGSSFTARLRPCAAARRRTVWLRASIRTHDGQSLSAARRVRLIR
jgi:endo-1,4-beta-xylanase